MKKYLKIGLLSLALTTTLFVSCKKNIQELNDNRNALTKLDASALELMFSNTLYKGIFAGEGDGGAYQLFQSLFTDQRVQYFACDQKAFPSDRNVMVGRWLDGAWSQFYSGATQLQFFINSTAEGAEFASPEKNAMAKIWKVYIFMPVTDAFGPVPYSQIENDKGEILYDSQEDIYKDFFKILKEASATLNKYSGDKVMPTGDLIFGGNTKAWLKMANSLRLRCAMRLSKKDPNLAKTEGEAAANAPGGLMSASVDNALLKVNANTPNPLAAISNWGEFRMSAAMQSVLQGYDDPRMIKYFSPALGSGTYKGYRNGLSVDEMALFENKPENNSNLGPEIGYGMKASAPYPIMVSAETYFLLAEAKLKGWNVSGTVKDNYEKGVKASMEQWGVLDSADAYLKRDTLTPIALHDMFKTPALNNLPPTFSSDPTKQLEQIINQKWLALFPVSPEAWSEMRRTGFPKLYDRIHSDNLDASVNYNSVKRLIYPTGNVTLNPKGYASGLSKLGGADKVNVKVWWDVN